MGLRLVNTSPGEIVGSVKPEQTIYMGLKSESQRVNFSSLKVDVALSSFRNSGLLPEADPHLEELGVSTAFVTSERRTPISASVSKSFTGNSLVLTKTTNFLTEEGIYELKIPVGQTNSVLGYFKFRKKNVWVQHSADWCNLTNLVGMYFGVEFGPYNTAAYAFLRNNGSGGSVVFGGPLQAINTTRPGQVELAQDLNPDVAGTQGWLSLSDNSVIELFILINTYTTPYRAELWTRIAATAAPVYQGNISLPDLGTFPAPGSITNNTRQGPTNTATLFFGNIGKTGDILQLDDWALYPDYRRAVINGAATANHNLLVLPDSPISYRVEDKLLPEELPVGRWFPTTGVSYLTPSSVFSYLPGRAKTPMHLSLKKEGLGAMEYHRTEPCLESLQGGFFVESLISGDSTQRDGDLVGPGLVVEDGQKALKLLMLETPSARTYGIASNDAAYNDAGSYHTPAGSVDWRSPKLLRMTVDRFRSRVTLTVDEQKVLELPILSKPELSFGEQTFPTTALAGTSLVVEVSSNAGATWTAKTHAFSAQTASLQALLTELSTDAIFLGADLQIVDKGETFAIRLTNAGPNYGIRLGAATTCIGSGKLVIDASGPFFGQQTVLPASSSSVGRVAFGHPYFANYTADLKLASLRYLTNYGAWECEDSVLPTSTSLDVGARFTLDVSGAGAEVPSPSGMTLTKSGHTSSGEHRFFTKTQNLNDLGAVQIDFSVHVVAYADRFGQVNAPNTALGAGVAVFLGTKRLLLNFFDCGVIGKKIGIVPATGTVDDIIKQTPLGIAYSAEVDWTKPNIYRLVVRPYYSIEVWSGTTIDAPMLSIPWRNATDGFDLPEDFTPPSVAFGHFDFFTYPTASTTLWKYFRWGYSTGYEVAVQQKYPDGYAKYLFGGQELILSEFDES